MNILFVGNTQGTSTSLHYFTSLVRLGHTVLPWDPQYFRVENPLDGVVQKLNRGPSPWKVRKINRQLIRLCRQNAFDLVFVMGENFVTREAIETVRAEAVTTPRFLFHSHDNLFAPGILKPADFFQNLSAFDFAFTTKSQNETRYQQLGQKNAKYLPSAFEPTVHRPIPRAQSRLNQDFPASFIGTYDGSRLRWLQKAGWDRVHVWGDGWTRFPDYKKYQTQIFPHAVYYFEFADVCSRSKCALGLLREEADDRHTQRTFEIPACGSLQFAPRNAEIQTFFEDGKEIVLFDSPEELREKLDYYLSHESERTRLAEAGHRRCLAGGHTYDDRTKQMLADIA